MVPRCMRSIVVGRSKNWSYGTRCARPELLATKAEAFEDRGRRDFVASKDVEDFLSVVNGRPELLDELREAPPEVRGYVSDTVAAWLRDNDFMEALPGQLAGDDASQARVSVLVARLRSIAELPR